MNRPTVPEVGPLVAAYYTFPGCGVGGCLHIVLDDGNIEDSNIHYCIECASDPTFWVSQTHYSGHDEAGELLGRLLLLLSKTQRAKVCGWAYKESDMTRPDFIKRCKELLGQDAEASR
jgi:hypothetical protein